MREFFINSLEKLISVIVVLLCIGVVVSALVVMFSGQPGAFFSGLGILVFGAIYAIMLGGMMYLFVGIHDNTKRTAEAIERMSQSNS